MTTGCLGFDAGRELVVVELDAVLDRDDARGDELVPLQASRRSTNAELTKMARGDRIGVCTPRSSRARMCSR